MDYYKSHIKNIIFFPKLEFSYSMFEEWKIKEIIGNKIIIFLDENNIFKKKKKGKSQSRHLFHFDF